MTDLEQAIADAKSDGYRAGYRRNRPMPRQRYYRGIAAAVAAYETEYDAGERSRWSDSLTGEDA